MTFLFDTNVASELRKVGDGKADPHVVHWISGLNATTLYLSAITLMEIEQGILRIERRDPVQGDKLRAWMDRHVLPEFAAQTLPVDAAVALRCAPLPLPDPRPERDAFLAATALVHGMTMATRAAADFAATGVPLLNPWENKTGSG